jgi:fructose-1,6-bisphosphatase/inositol monophosphatase family enzyme
MTLDVKSIADLLRSAAKAEILPRFRRLGGDDVRIKSELTDLVTEADEAAERRIRAEFEALAPGYLFVGEESVAADPDLLGKLATADKALVVDPIDGTFNFASGLPLFGVMAAVISGGETVAGIIYDPMGDDWMIAEKGAGTYFVRPDGHSERAKVAEPLPLDDGDRLGRFPAEGEAAGNHGQSRQGALRDELSLRRTRIPRLLRRPYPVPDVQQADALGSPCRHVDVAGGGRLCRAL